MIQLLKERMMTLLASGAGLIAFAESHGVDVLEIVGSAIGGNETTGSFMGVVVGVAGYLYQNHLNKNARIN